MAYKPTRMDQIKKIIEFHQKGTSIKQIARLLGMSRNTVKLYIRRFEQRDIDIHDLESPELWQEIYRSENVHIPEALTPLFRAFDPLCG